MLRRFNELDLVGSDDLSKARAAKFGVDEADRATIKQLKRWPRRSARKDRAQVLKRIHAILKQAANALITPRTEQRT